MTANLSAPHALLIVENSPFPVLIVDRHGCVSGYNQAFAALLGPAQAAELLNALQFSVNAIASGLRTTG